MKKFIAVVLGILMLSAAVFAGGKPDKASVENAVTGIGYHVTKGTRSDMSYREFVSCPAMILNHSGALLFEKECYDKLVKEHAALKPEGVILNVSGYVSVDLSSFGTYYKVTQDDKLHTNGKYYLLNIPFSEKTKGQARSKVIIPQIFSNHKKLFKDTLGEKPNVELHYFLSQHIPGADFAKLAVYEQGEDQNLTEDLKKAIKDDLKSDLKVSLSNYIS
ncbi:hypothetical protein Dip518_001464 [Parelusimicrobium proximum]|uniref:hypothetical protein n=1 Tax=Parelusimicrobium proximum TaxID=3228953 RepID=UPI003D1636A8